MAKQKMKLVEIQLILHYANAWSQKPASADSSMIHYLSGDICKS